MTSLLLSKKLTISGKSTIGHALSHSLSLPFIDGDTLHPQSNIDKMSAGHPLTDNDRLPWLALIRSTAERISRDEWNDQGFAIKSVEDGGLGRPGVVIACSALKKWYRDILRGEIEAAPPAKEDLVSASYSSSLCTQAVFGQRRLQALASQGYTAMCMADGVGTSVPALERLAPISLVPLGFAGC